jgi:regulator of protease activity HflC (stomatin/prohibitin superfamily)
MKPLVAAILGVTLLVAILGFAGPIWNVWASGLMGEAQLRMAQQNRQIRVQEAQAKLEASLLDAQAEVNLAKGTAQANEILAKGLGGPEGYIRWMYIHMLEETASKPNREIIYIPTEGGIPILEAGKSVP